MGVIAWGRIKELVKGFKPYFFLLRLHSVEISLVMICPACVSIVFTSASLGKAFWLIGLSIVGGVVIRSAGCVVNDVFDKQIDAEVTRTKSRPLACGELTVTQALIVLAVLLCVAVVILLFTNVLAFFTSAFFALLIVLYPLMKRSPWCPQIMLGIVANCGALIGSAMSVGKFSFDSVLLYIGCIFWTIGYDTIYAHQDKRDDARLGLKSAALDFGDNTKTMLGRLYTFTVTMWMCAGVMASMGTMYYLCLLAISWMFYRQSKKSNFDNPEECMYTFRSNVYVGVLLLAGASLGRI